ncbi:PTS system protein [Klebsiella michiganensis]|uniref:PTS system protein n=1 Tax=Klebsiella michiganensis TaxID=1134687 RepID=A0A7H4M3K5_9ENTR|nr:PTS system protein [Klebsiella michiganensis]
MPDLLVRRIHGSLIVTGIMNPFWMANLSANQAALAAGAALPHVYLQGFWDHYLLIGGVGSTLPLAFLLLRSRVTHLRTIGKMGIVPSFFNINEPILFGAPIIMNPMMFIPFVFVPMINAVLAYGATTPRLAQPGRFADAVDDAGAYRRIMGCKLDAKPGGDVFNLHGDVGGNLPALPARL